VGTLRFAFWFVRSLLCFPLLLILYPFARGEVMRTIYQYPAAVRSNWRHHRDLPRLP